MSEPIYADRLSGEKFADASTMVNAYLFRYAQQRRQEPQQLDEGGYAQLLHGEAVVGINVLEDRGVLMIFAPVIPVPLTGVEALYRRLLEASFVQTSDAAFAIDRARDEVVVRSLRRLSALDYEEFEDLVATVSQVADSWHGELQRDFGR
ncbi:CesT family type III secretion system chaperone [Chondromyces crocatus]|nr:CesT family type III secretion system chaperone [Chondromyces crocatus]